MKYRAIAACVMIAGVSLSACGGSSSDDTTSASADYCKELKAAAANIGEATATTSIENSLKDFHQLAASAPSAVSADWKVLDGAFADLEKAFKKAKVDLSDTDAAQKAITSGKIPIKVIQKLTSADLTKARTAIEKHAKSACNVDFSGS